MSKPTCCGEVVEGVANHKTYWYCRSCKKEVEVTIYGDNVKWENPFTDWVQMHFLKYHNNLKNR